MTPLSEALVTAQRRALAALEKAYVAGELDGPAFRATLFEVGINDPVDAGFLLASLDVLREWGVQAPTTTERVADEKMSDKQREYIIKLAREKVGAQLGPDDLSGLSKQDASTVIEGLQRGELDLESVRVPF